MRQFYHGDENLEFPKPSETFIRGIDDSNLPHVIADEGFNYFFEYYINQESVIDPDLGKLVKEYTDASKRLREYISERVKGS